METKICKTCPYLVGNDPYICELADIEINPEFITDCCWYPKDEVKLNEFYASNSSIR